VAPEIFPVGCLPGIAFHWRAPGIDNQEGRTGTADTCCIIVLYYFSFVEYIW